MAGQLAGRLAIVTGGGSGIGRAVCQVFAREGARVAAVDITKDNIQDTVKDIGSERHASFVADVSSSSDLTSLMTQIKDRFQDVPSVAVNCAGITRDNLFFKLKEDMFDEVMNVNLKGTFLMSQAVAKLMAENQIPEGSIVNIASIVGKTGNIGQTNYSASKAGVVGFTKSAALELAKLNIRVNAVLPGFIVTPMTDVLPEKVIEKIKRGIPLRRQGTPEEIAETCLFLASSRSSYITGTTIEVTGGLSM